MMMMRADNIGPNEPRGRKTRAMTDQLSLTDVKKPKINKFKIKNGGEYLLSGSENSPDDEVLLLNHQESDYLTQLSPEDESDYYNYKSSFVLHDDQYTEAEAEAEYSAEQSEE